MSASLVVPANIDELGPGVPCPREGRLYQAASEGQATRASTKKCQANAAVAPAFATEQIRGLIHRVFSPDCPKSTRQVVISSAAAEVNTGGVCAQIVRQMTAALPGRVCAVEADVRSPGLVHGLVSSMPRPGELECRGCIHVDANLWLAEPHNLFSAENDGFSAAWLRTRINELRRDFDYTLIHAPAAMLTQTVVLGQLADGLILVIQAGKTHRAVVQTALTVLKAAKVSVLGTVLIDRTFPIPEKLYKWL